MLDELGIRGVRVHEVLGLDEEMLSSLPRPVHALIFLFRYEATEETQLETECPDHIWFANQLPDHACASVALVNIVNNIKGLKMGSELREFKASTASMNPMQRGDAIDRFDFVRNIHNSFARESDLLNADLLAKDQADRQRKKNSAAKNRKAKEVKQNGNDIGPDGAAGTSFKPARSSRRARRATMSAHETSYETVRPPHAESEAVPYSPGRKEVKPAASRRSARKPKPRKDMKQFTEDTSTFEESAYHFVAYMPIDGHMWKLDGLDKFPHDMGTYGDENANADWLTVAQPHLQAQMAMYSTASIDFNLMAIVHDPAITQRAELVLNIRLLQICESRLDLVYEDWRSMDDTIVGPPPLTSFSLELGITPVDLSTVSVPAQTEGDIAKDDNLLSLLERRNTLVSAQSAMCVALMAMQQGHRDDEETAKHQRHDYSAFVRSWLNQLAEHELLTELVDAHA